MNLRKMIPGTPRYRYAAARGYARALPLLVRGMQLGIPPEQVARFVRLQPFPVSVRLSHMVEDAAHGGTFACAVFDVLANG